MVAVTLTAACIRLPCGRWGRKNTGKNLVCGAAGVKYTAHLENCFADCGQNIDKCNSSNVMQCGAEDGVRANVWFPKVKTKLFFIIPMLKITPCFIIL